MRLIDDLDLQIAVIEHAAATPATTAMMTVAAMPAEAGAETPVRVAAMAATLLVARHKQFAPHSAAAAAGVLPKLGEPARSSTSASGPSVGNGSA